MSEAEGENREANQQEQREHDAGDGKGKVGIERGKVQGKDGFEEVEGRVDGDGETAEG